MATKKMPTRAQLMKETKKMVTERLLKNPGFVRRLTRFMEAEEEWILSSVERDLKKKYGIRSTRKSAKK